MIKKQSRAGASSICNYFLFSMPLWGMIGMDVVRRPEMCLWLYTSLFLSFFFFCFSYLYLNLYFQLSIVKRIWRAESSR